MKEKSIPPSFSLVYRHPALIISTFFGSGCLSPAPGTWGSFAAWGAFYLLTFVLEPSLMWALVLVTFFLGVWSVNKSAPLLGATDHGSFVIDEVAAVWIVLLLIPQTFFWQLAGVLAFRFFDILKPPPVSFIDRAEQNGWTVMADDVFAAVYALFVLNIAAYFLK
jgi:phosphatidylglycerophosphatase A